MTDYINRWTSLPLSLIGCINIIKMNVLPTFLYLFQSLPLHPPSSFFPRMKKIFTNVIWNNQRPRLRLSLLYLPYERGGLQVPNLSWYYWAAQIRAAMCWFLDGTPIPWVEIERYTTTPLPLNLYLFSDSPKQLKKNTKNPFVRNTVDVWFKVQSHLKSQISSFTPVWGNRRFIPGTYDSGFKMWANRGINKISDLYDDNKLMTFEMLRNKHHIPSTHFFKYLQLRSYISKAQNHSLLCPPLSKLETIIVHHSSGHGQVSLIYDLCKTESEESSENKRLAWSTDLNAEVTIEEWGQICHKAQVQTINTRFDSYSTNGLCVPV